MFFKNKKSAIIPIDFHEPWWHVPLSQRWYLFLSCFGEVFITIFNTLTPLIFGAIFELKRFDYFIYFSASYLLIVAFHYWVKRALIDLELRCIHSTHYHAHTWFLTVDPIYHAHRESGAILGKIDRASRSYEELLDAISIEILPALTGVITALISLGQESLTLSLLLLALLVGVVILNIILARAFIVPLEQKLIKADDAVKTASVENLAQFNLIRSYFASPFINEQLRIKDEKVSDRERRLWNANVNLYTSIKAIYQITVFILGWYLLIAINNGAMSIVTGISLLLMYLRGTYDIIYLERPIRVTLRSVTRIQDLYSFIIGFGQQTYPVLPTDPHEIVSIERDTTIDLNANDISFMYHNHQPLLKHHTLELVVPWAQEHKLYGIIGPSGIGKSTLLSILGGQIKPTTGNVMLNGIDIYTLDDTERQTLLAMQGQVAASLRGTLKYNLLFGLPENHHYQEQHLITVLKQVGLWDIFKLKQGLLTSIGEGGMSLSGGQRQRLNFASLYLRAQFFKPILILIDEPTSSLDEVSEQAITQMILELSKNALTIVIAHRLKTLENAAGILDFSQVITQKNIKFMTPQELLQTSEYYQQLMTGKKSL